MSRERKQRRDARRAANDGGYRRLLELAARAEGRKLATPAEYDGYLAELERRGIVTIRPDLEIVGRYRVSFDLEQLMTGGLSLEDVGRLGLAALFGIQEDRSAA